MNTSANEKMREALHQISLCSQNSASSKEECGRIARDTLSTVHTQEASGEAEWRIKVMDAVRAYASAHINGNMMLADDLFQRIHSMLAALQSQAGTPAEREGWKPTHAEVLAWNDRNGGWFQGRLDEARCAIDDARSMHQLSATPQQQEQSGEAVDAYNLHCKTCNGHGFVTYSVRHGESDFEDFEQECPVCDGAGKAPKHVQDLQARYQEVRSELHALNMKIGMESLLGPSPATTASQESAPGQEALVVAWREVMPDGKPFCSWIDGDGGLRVSPAMIGNRIELAYSATPTSTAIAAMVIKQAAESLEPFALISSEGVIQQESGHVTVTTCAEYFHRARQLLEKLTPATAEAELEALMMKVATAVAEESRGGIKADDYTRLRLRTIARRALDEMKGE